MASQPWPNVRLTLRADLARDFRQWCGQAGADPADVLELLVTSADRNHPERAGLAMRVIARIAAHETAFVYDLPTPADADVAVARMGPPVSETGEPVGPIRRDHRGVELTDDAATAWAAGRGYWVMASRQPQPQYLAISRLGLITHVFRTDRWDSINTTPTRYWATHGWLIDPEARTLQAIDPQARKRKVPAVTERDLAVLDALSDQIITYPPDKAGTSLLRLNGVAAAQREYQSAWRAARAATQDRPRHRLDRTSRPQATVRKHRAR